MYGGLAKYRYHKTSAQRRNLDRLSELYASLKNDLTIAAPQEPQNPTGFEITEATVCKTATAPF